MRIVFDEIEGNGDIHLDVIKVICGTTENKSMIDLCCGFAPQTRQLGFKNKLYVDVVYRDLMEESDDFRVMDVLAFMKGGGDHGKYFDVSIMLDGIEHFRKDDANYILDWMYENSDKQIIFTPLGDYVIETVPTNHPDSHKSGWMPEDFEAMGWNTIVFPKFHALLGIGAFFAFNCPGSNEPERIKLQLTANSQQWRK